MDKINVPESNKEFYEIAKKTVIEVQRASTAFLRRRFDVGYFRAAMIIDKLEQEGIISAPNKRGERKVLQNRQ